MTISNSTLEGMTLTVKLGPEGVVQFQKFLSEQFHRHADAECLFPGYEFVVGHWEPLDFWEVEVQVGSARVVIEDATVKLDNDVRQVST